MSGGIYMAASGALAYEKRLQLISNNLANANTVGYKMDHGQFQSIDPADLPPALSPASSELNTSQAQSFWFQFNSYTDFTHGSLKNTGNDFDLALVGDGFFCVQKPDGVHYTRKGNFTLNAEGVLVTGNGYPVVGDGGEIEVKGSENPHQFIKFTVDRSCNKADLLLKNMIAPIELFNQLFHFCSLDFILAALFTPFFIRYNISSIASL